MNQSDKRRKDYLKYIHKKYIGPENKDNVSIVVILIQHKIPIKAIYKYTNNDISTIIKNLYNILNKTEGAVNITHDEFIDILYLGILDYNRIAKQTLPTENKEYFIVKHFLQDYRNNFIKTVSTWPCNLGPKYTNKIFPRVGIDPNGTSYSYLVKKSPGTSGERITYTRLKYQPNTTHQKIS